MEGKRIERTEGKRTERTERRTEKKKKEVTAAFDSLHIGLL